MKSRCLRKKKMCFHTFYLTSFSFYDRDSFGNNKALPLLFENKFIFNVHLMSINHLENKGLVFIYFKKFSNKYVKKLKNH